MVSVFEYTSIHLLLARTPVHFDALVYGMQLAAAELAQIGLVAERRKVFLVAVTVDHRLQYCWRVVTG